MGILFIFITYLQLVTALFMLTELFEIELFVCMKIDLALNNRRHTEDHFEIIRKSQILRKSSKNE